MKSATATSVMLFCMVLILQGPALAGPKLTMPQSEFDFGFVPQMAKISHDFWLYSTGDSTLKIIKVSPG